MASIIEHGVVCRLPGEEYNYFGWPSVAMMPDGTIIAASSGLRKHHVDPWGKTVLNFSYDGGKTFTSPRVITDSLIDDRDAGIVALGGDKALVSWFTLDIRRYGEGLAKGIGDEDYKVAKAYMDTWSEDDVKALRGSWVKLSDDGGKTWGKMIRCPVTTPHGPSVARDGRLIYLGKEYPDLSPDGRIALAESMDGGNTWEVVGIVPLPEGKTVEQFHEPHVIELNDGSYLGVIRYHREDGWGGIGIYQSKSYDRGRTWEMPYELPLDGTPPHLLKHSSGKVVMVYGYRLPGYGQRARVTEDGGATWGEEIILRDDGNGPDLGYPSSIELSDGSIFTLYYQAYGDDKVCSLLYTIWRL